MSRRRPFVMIGLGATAAVALVGGGVALWFFNRTDHTTTVVDLDDALASYRAETSVPPTVSPPPPPAASSAPSRTPTPASTTASPTPTTAAPITVPAAALPGPGVYAYTTTGGDAVDALGGAAHAYPATTTLVVTPADCGVTQRWTAAEERWDEVTTCVGDGGVTLRSFTSFHRFFGQDDRRTGVCQGEARPVGAAAGTTWVTHCVRNGVPETWTGTVVGVESMLVGDRPVNVEHVTVTIDNAVPTDRQQTDTWYVGGSDLVARRTATNATSEDSPVGVVHYTEQFEIVLDSLTPAE